jgi:hypothetical protein
MNHPLPPTNNATSTEFLYIENDFSNFVRGDLSAVWTRLSVVSVVSVVLVV